MKAHLLTLCVLLIAVVGCDNANQVDRYKVFSGSWQEVANHTTKEGDLNAVIIDRKELVKLDSVTGRVWFWHRSTWNTNDQCGWIEMTDSGYLLPASLQNKSK